MNKIKLLLHRIVKPAEMKRIGFEHKPSTYRRISDKD